MAPARRERPRRCARATAPRSDSLSVCRPPPVHEERRARDVDDAVREGALQHRVGVDVGRQRRPQEEPAPRRGPGHDVAERLLERALHHVALVLVVPAQPRHLALEDAPAARLVDDVLVERARAEVGGLLGHLHARGERRRRRQPGHAEPGRERLREAAQVDDASLAVVGLDRPDVGRARAVLEVQLAVRIVLEDQDVLPRGPLQQARALVPSDEQARRVLEVGDDVEGPHAAALGADARRDGVEVVEVDAVGLLPHADEHPPARCGTR